jgi:hypothetical protein
MNPFEALNQLLSPGGPNVSRSGRPFLVPMNEDRPPTLNPTRLGPSVSAETPLRRDPLASQVRAFGLSLPLACNGDPRSTTSLQAISIPEAFGDAVHVSLFPVAGGVGTTLAGPPISRGYVVPWCGVALFGGLVGLSVAELPGPNGAAATRRDNLFLPLNFGTQAVSLSQANQSPWSASFNPTPLAVRGLPFRGLGFVVCHPPDDGVTPDSYPWEYATLVVRWWSESPSRPLEIS